jgi:vancomycin resistance protein YoaR
MPEQYYQEYGPISRRRASGELLSDPYDDALPEPPPRAVRQPPRIPHLAAAPPRVRRARRRRVWPLLLTICLVALGALAAAPYALSFWQRGVAFGNVSIQGQLVGGMEAGAISAALQSRYQAFLDAPLTLSFEGRTWSPTLSQLGARLDLDATAADALAVGRRGGPIERARELWALWRGGVDLAPRLTVDGATLQAYLAGLAAEIDQPPRDAALNLAGGRVEPVAAVPGRQLLVDTSAAEVLQALHTLAPQAVVLRTRTLAPTLGDADIAAAAADAKALLAGPLVLKRGDRTVTWNEAKIARMLATRVSGGKLAVEIDQGWLVREVGRLAQLVDTPSAEPRVAFRRGKLTITKPGETGWRLKQPEAAAAIAAALREPRRDLELPATAIEPSVTPKNLASLGIVEVVGEGKTSFAGSAPYRVTNIKAGAARMNGVLIAPGQEFSFNSQLGAVDESNGFVKGYAVIGNRTQLEWGGGVCQDSTTLFRAAFWAGLPFTEWHPHPFYISWYDDFAFPNDAGPGMDATIFTGQLDLRFVNDTGHWLLIEAAVDDAKDVLTVRLYGTKPNRTVSVRGPVIDNIVPPPENPVYVNDPSLPAGTLKQTDHARKGMDITVYRVITENGVEKPAEAFFTSFKAWPDVFVRGTGR